MKKAVFFDIDGTLWNEHMQIPESTKSAVAALRAGGNYAFLCSGRSRSNIRNEQLLGIGFDGVIAACGTHIDFCGQKVYEELMGQEELAHVLEVTKRHGISVILEGPDYLYMDDDAFPGDPFVDYLRGEMEGDIRPVTGNAKFVANKLSAVLNGADLERIKQELDTYFCIIAHTGEVIEIVPKNHSKATGIARVCELLDIAHEDTYAFGDSANDLEMLDFVAHGIAMGNGTAEVKQAAEFVTTDIMKDGIRNGLRHYGLI